MSKQSIHVTDPSCLLDEVDPVGDIQIPESLLSAVSGGEEALTSKPCLIIIGSLLTCSDAVSCTPSCDASVWDGTCNVASIGCCTMA